MSDTIRDRWLSFDYLSAAQQDQARRAWREPLLVGLDLARTPDRSALVITGRRTGKTAELERRIREALAAGTRVIECYDSEGAREVTVDAAGNLVRPGRPC